jgi:hypothetical protein
LRCRRLCEEPGGRPGHEASRHSTHEQESDEGRDIDDSHGGDSPPVEAPAAVEGPLSLPQRTVVAVKPGTPPATRSHDGLREATTTADTTASTAGGTAAILGGLAWLLLIPDAELHRCYLLSYDGYNLLLAIPLPLFLAALLAASRALTAPGRSVRAGFLTAAAGVGLLLAGNVTEFYGVLLQEQANAYAVAGAGRPTTGWARRSAGSSSGSACSCCSSVG